MIPPDERFLQSLMNDLLVSGGRLNEGRRLALRELLYRRGAGIADLRGTYTELVKLTGKANALIEGVEVFKSIPPPPPLPAHSDYVEIAKFVDSVREGLIEFALEAAPLLERGTQSPEWNAAARAYLDQLMRNEYGEVNRSEPASKPQCSADRIGPNLPKLRATLRDVLASPDLEIFDYSIISGGFSRDTMLLKTRARNVETPYIIRAQQLAEGWMDCLGPGIEGEFPIIQFAHEQGIPAPRAHALVTDHTVIGSSFIVMEFRPGVVIGNTMTATGTINLELLENFANVLAKIHMLPWQNYRDSLPAEFCVGYTATMEQATRIYLEKIERYCREGVLRPSPSIALALDWLKRNVPQSKAAPLVVHGDIGFHNMLLLGPEICAVLDWDACAIGCPARDLVAAKLMFSNPSDWEEFVRIYVAAGARPPVEEELNYFGMVRSLQGNVACAMALERMFGRGEKLDYLELGVAARPFYTQLFRTNATRIWNPE